jgi:alpha-1,2-glucosyltransferase
MPCGDPVVGWRAQLDWQGRARAAPGVPPAMPNANLYNAGLWIVGGFITVDSPLYPVRVLYSLVNDSFNFTLILVYFAIYCLASIWASQVTKFVTYPYLVCLPSITRTPPNNIQDEVFHIPQTQAYCSGRFDVWDPKLTTPPGL